MGVSSVEIVCPRTTATTPDHQRGKLVLTKQQGWLDARLIGAT